MRPIRFLATAAMALTLAACNEPTAPIDADVEFARTTKNSTLTSAVADDGTSDVTTNTRGRKTSRGSTASDAPETTITQSPDAPPLMTYATSFKAVQGEGNTFVVFYQNPWNPDTYGEWFMKLDVPKDAQFVDENGTDVAAGDTVEVTVEIDANRFFVQFGPHGSTFVGNKPAQLKFNYEFADLSGLDPANLEVWYQPSADTQWNPEPTTVDLNGNRVIIELYHFSNYAVAW